MGYALTRRLTTECAFRRLQLIVFGAFHSALSRRAKVGNVELFGRQRRTNSAIRRLRSGRPH